MKNRHKWPYILTLLWLILPLISTAPSKNQLHRLVGGHLRTFQIDSDDSELIIASAAGENSKNQKNTKNSDDRKTLSQQVADGKYGLIQKEIFKKPPKRPGIISYAPNSEVPKDNIATLGGLTKNDIWLAENHLLVIKGGTYPPPDDAKQDLIGPIWQPIDDYNAPLHQVKIPKNPVVPPPFPVQLTDDGPLQILGTNSSRTLNASAETPAYALPPPPDWDGEIPPQNQYFPETGSTNSDKAHPTTGQTEMRIPESGEPPGGLPFPPALLNGSLPPSLERLPPGAVILPPLSQIAKGNETSPEILDEDDPSIYYPPPYSFFYPKDNSSVVPPGPLVPGIILPPPPKFFAPLEDDTSTTTTRKPLTSSIRPVYITTRHPTTTTKPITIPTRVSVVKNYSQVTVKIATSKRPPSHHNSKTSPTATTGKPKLITILPVHVDKLNRTYLPAAPSRRKPPVTILRPVQNTENVQKVQEFFKSNKETSNKYNTIFTTTQVPLKYHQNTPQVEKYPTAHGSKAQKPPTNFYFYEETDPALNVITTEEPLPKENPEYLDDWHPYYVPRKPPRTKPQYIYVTRRPYETVKPKFRYVQQTPSTRPKLQNTFSIHIAKLQNQLHQYYTTTHRPKPVYQYSFEAQNFRRPPTGGIFRPSPLMNDNDDGFKPIQKYSVEIQPAIEIIPTQRPNYQQIQPFNVDEPSFYTSTSRPSQQFLPKAPPPLRYLPVKNNPPEEEPEVVVTPSRPIAEFSYEVTPNPVYQGFYTKPDEGYFDDNTKQYFTIFGRKLQSSTTSLPPPALANDVKVNYVNPRPPINVEQSEDVRPELVKAIAITPLPPPRIRDGGRERYIHYQLPGDEGAHFYFLTPQAAERRRQGQGEYFFEKKKDGGG
ncbi:hypothetical protein ABEB36_003947 [Hypothenemus hampei]|uniref:Uncharacterized protein n=1 Tax=Hypothenemus hampei TaxID=57062 RepID=A0ABD1F2A0_HYPHA